jgi:hypothetical protein
MYIKLNNGVPENYSIGQLRKDNINTSFPRHLTAELLAEHDVYAVTHQPMPDATATQKVELNESPTLVDGSWEMQWNVIDKTSEEIAADNAIKSESVRSIRDERLAATDWTALTDVTMAAEMATYRQALRDITDHANFPNLQNTDWPETP